jgi:hypothetical protein
MGAMVRFPIVDGPTKGGPNPSHDIPISIHQCDFHTVLWTPPYLGGSNLLDNDAALSIEQPSKVDPVFRYDIFHSVGHYITGWDYGWI